jgi:hypothetical protein
MSSPTAAAQLGLLAAFVGEWRGEGRGLWGDARFGYGEQLVFVHAGKPQLAYRQRTRAADDGRPLHAEDGFWRVADGGVELVLAQGIGIVEICRASWDAGVLRARASALMGTPSAKTVTDVERTYAVEGDVMRVSMRMATDGGALRPHLEATLKRVH